MRSKKEKNEESRLLLNKRFLDGMNTIIRHKRAKNQTDFCKIMEERGGAFSQIKSDYRNATLTNFFDLINKFDLDANYFLKKDNSNHQMSYTETSISPSISGRNENVMVGKNVTLNKGEVKGNFYSVENMINEASPEVKSYIEKLTAKQEALEKENNRFRDEMRDLKKILNSTGEQLKDANSQLKEKDERLYQAQRELIEAYKKK